MKLLKAKVDWMEKFGNDPRLKVLVDKVPNKEDLRYSYKNGLYYAELDGYVSFFSYRGPGNGFGGNVFDIVMTDGRNVSLVGPWSSRAAVANSVGFGPCLDVSITENPDSYERGYTFCSGHILMDLVERNKHLVSIGKGYNKLCGCGCMKEEECYIEFPEGSTFYHFKQVDGHYSPAVMFPDKKVWVKNIYSSTSFNEDLEANQVECL